MALVPRRSLPQRSAHELAVMRRAGRVVAEMHDVIRHSARAGMTTLDLDQLARDVLNRRGASSNFLNYHGFPAVICASVNEEVIHGIPGPRVLADGDIVSIDCGAIVEGWHGDAAFTMGIGTVSAAAQRLMAVAQDALDAGIAEMVPGGHVGDIGAAVDRVVSAAGFGSPTDYCGHGIGRAMHEDPDVPNRGRAGKGPKLAEGVVLALEPMLIMGGTDHTDVLDDGWTVVTADGSMAAHVEHTVVVTDRGPEILTRL